MAHPRPFRFGVQVAGAPTAEAWAATARRAEYLGFSSLVVPDHFGDQLAPGPALVAAAGATSTLRLGCLVYDNDYRHPVVLAKEAATVDVLSGGRLELGIGAGWMRRDYEQSGIPLERPGLRIERMLEAVEVLNGLFAPGPFTYEGSHYRVTGLDGQPKPVQSPRPPLVVGGGGRRVLTAAATVADIVGINPDLRSGEVGPEAAGTATGAATDRKVGWVREAAGDRYGDIELTMLVLATVVTDDRDGVRAGLAAGFGLDQADEVPHAWIGTCDQIADDLARWRDRWDVSYWVVQGTDAMEAIAPVVARLAGT